MQSKTPFIIVGIILALGIIGGVAYATMNKTETDNHDATHSQDESSSDESMTMSPEDNNASSNDSEQSSEAVQTDMVEIKNFEFTPKTITVKAGTKVTWTNQDSARHNVVSDGEGDLDGPLLAKGESWDYTFNEPGTFKYLCSPHPYMKGTVIVTE